uniref:NADH-ubiquinone oxidoreductase chain 3 n=1 Tax=Epimeria cornigera TaxID=1582882 RepID=A0A2S1TMB1_9CRUS|nr:NADH dehydrogenase subunit 3 [Epimeria cornigera]
MINLLLYLLLSISIPVLLMLITLFTGKKSFKDREKLTPFECGFDPNKKAHVPFSLRFFLIIIIFLVFDVEVVVILPLGIIPAIAPSYPMIITSVIIITILILGLLHEWNQGALNWA